MKFASLVGRILAICIAVMLWGAAAQGFTSDTLVTGKIVDMKGRKVKGVKIKVFVSEPKKLCGRYKSDDNGEFHFTLSNEKCPYATIEFKKSRYYEITTDVIIGGKVLNIGPLTMQQTGRRGISAVVTVPAQGAAIGVQTGARSVTFLGRTIECGFRWLFRSPCKG